MDERLGVNMRRLVWGWVRDYRWLGCGCLIYEGGQGPKKRDKRVRSGRDMGWRKWKAGTYTKEAERPLWFGLTAVVSSLRVST